MGRRSYRMCQHLTSGELQNQFELFISSCKTDSGTSFQTRIYATTGLIVLPAICNKRHPGNHSAYCCHDTSSTTVNYGLKRLFWCCSGFLGWVRNQWMPGELKNPSYGISNIKHASAHVYAEQQHDPGHAMHSHLQVWKPRVPLHIVRLPS